MPHMFNGGDSTWRDLITEEFKVTKECWGDVLSCTLTEEDLDVQFDEGYGAILGKPFTLWTNKRVYFPKDYDGVEECCSVSRNPDGKPTEHV